MLRVGRFCHGVEAILHIGLALLVIFKMLRNLLISHGKRAIDRIWLEIFGQVLVDTASLNEIDLVVIDPLHIFIQECVLDTDLHRCAF